MVSKNQIKRITSLQQKKFRKQEQLFFVEGIKGIQELLDSNFELAELYTTNPELFAVDSSKVYTVSPAELQKISALTTPNTCLALFKIPEVKAFEEKGLILAVDDVRDPGNLGTIIRLCDWFGIKTLYCSEESVDVYNPKVIQASMGAFLRIQVDYTDLKSYFQETRLPVFGALLEGENIYKTVVQPAGILLMGNEGNGISEELKQFITHPISIPRRGGAESLNVSIATGILLSEFFRNV